MKRQVTIAGLGLIGGSLGMALRRQGWHVAFVDPAVTGEQAAEAGAADERRESFAGDFVVLATPVDHALDALRHAAPAPLVTSTCSVMQPLLAVAHGVTFVAGHPFAGSERSGLGAARPDLFAGCSWFVDRDHPDVRAMIEAAGAKQVVVDPAAHDEALALTSHLPQVLSTALASLLSQKRIDPVYVGSGLRTFLRLAGSSADVWSPVLEANQDNVAVALDEILRVAEQLDAKDFDRAQAWARRQD